MRKRRGIDAIVVGAGLVGSATALGLARDGMRVALIEAYGPRDWVAEAAPDLRVFALSPASSDLLAELDVWPSIAAARATPYRHMRVWDAASPDDGIAFHARDIGLDALGHIVEQSLIQTMLWRALEQQPNVVLHCPARIAELHQDESGVDVELEDGTPLRASLLVGADGGASPLRQRLGIQSRERDYKARGVVAFVRTAKPHENTAWQRFLPGGPLAVLPFADGACSIVWSLPERDAERVLELDDDAFSAELERAFDSRLGSMTVESPRAGFPLRMRLAERYASGRAVLIGDAAHGVHPLAGQGLNLGFQDVGELLRLCREAHARDADIGAPLLLSRYNRRRRSETTLAAYTFDGIERLFSSDAVLPTLLRGPALAAVDRLTPLKRLFARHASGR